MKHFFSTLAAAAMAAVLTVSASPSAFAESANADAVSDIKFSEGDNVEFKLYLSETKEDIIGFEMRLFYDANLLEFDKNFHVEAYLQADTAYYYDVKRLWELRGRVSVRTQDGLRFNSEELFWDQNSHELYSNKFSRIVTPTRELEGTHFLSNEQLRLS